MPLYCCLLLCIFLCHNLFGQGLEELQRENQQLKERVAKLEQSLEVIQKSLPTFQEQKLKDELHQENQALADRVDKLEKKSDKNNLFEFYGYIKLDMAYDLARSYPGDYILWVESEENLEDDDSQFNFTANQTRVGVNIKGPNIFGAVSSGKIETDFYGGGNEQRTLLRIRQAYVKLDWQDAGFSILAGQTWDVISPLFPTTLNFLALGNSGDLANRRPQVRVTKVWTLGENHRVKAEGALSKVFGHSNIFYPSYLDPEEDSGFPTVQGRLSWEYLIAPRQVLSLGVYGLWDEESCAMENEGGKHEDYEAWLLGLDFCVPISPKIVIKTEFWMGQNLDGYLGGISQGINPTLQRSIFSRGGWIAIEFGPYDGWKFACGLGTDDPQNKDVNLGQRSRNYSVFGNTTYTFVDCLDVGLELSYWETSYKHAEKGNSVRIQTSVIYKF